MGRLKGSAEHGVDIGCERFFHIDFDDTLVGQEAQDSEDRRHAMAGARGGPLAAQR